MVTCTSYFETAILQPPKDLTKSPPKFNTTQIRSLKIIENAFVESRMLGDSNKNILVEHKNMLFLGSCRLRILGGVHVYVVLGVAHVLYFSVYNSFVVSSCFAYAQTELNQICHMLGFNKIKPTKEYQISFLDH